MTQPEHEQGQFQSNLAWPLIRLDYRALNLKLNDTEEINETVNESVSKIALRQTFKARLSIILD